MGVYVSGVCFQWILIRRHKYGDGNVRLVPDENVHKGTSKRHKTDGKSTHSAVHVSPINFFNCPTTPSTHSIFQWGFFYFQCWQRNLHHCFVSFFVLFSNPKTYLFLCRALIFCFVLVHPQLRQVSN